MKYTIPLTRTDQALKNDDDALRHELISKTLPNSRDKLLPKKEKIEDDLSVKHVAVLSYD